MPYVWDNIEKTDKKEQNDKNSLKIKEKKMFKERGG